MLVKRSLTHIEKMLPRESSEDRLDEKVFRLDVVICVNEEMKPILNVVPSVMELGKHLNSTCKAILGVVRGFARLEETLQSRIAHERTQAGQEELLLTKG